MNRLLPWLFVLCLSACTNYLAEEEELETDSDESVADRTYPMNVDVRNNASDSGTQPIQMYIFNQKGKLVHQGEVRSEEKNFQTNLSGGTYMVSAFSGLSAEEFSLPKTLTASSCILLKHNVPCTLPLQHGVSTFELQEETNIGIHLSYIVASINFNLTNVPVDATAVTLGISPVSKGYSMKGEYSKEQVMVKVSCRLVGDTWTAGPLYILPSKSAETVLSLSVKRGDGVTESFTYTYAARLQAAQPYTFKGKYREGITLGGKFEVDGWKPGIQVDFDFTEEGIPQEEVPSTPDDPDTPPTEEELQDVAEAPVFTADALPQAGETWNGFYVWKSEPSSESETVLSILSKEQWFAVYAADGLSYIEAYAEGGLTGWHVFTEKEAREFYAHFNSGESDVNGALFQLGQDELYCESSQRYLCNDCLSTFGLGSKLSIREAGVKTTYYLRAVKTVKVRLQQS